MLHSRRGGSNKMVSQVNYSDFINGGSVFRGYSLMIINSNSMINRTKYFLNAIHWKWCKQN